jgi:TolA-binding protein
MRRRFSEFEEKHMRGMILLLSALVLAAGCAASEPRVETVNASAKDIEDAHKALKHCESEIAIRNRQIAEIQEALAETRKGVEKGGESQEIEALRELSRQAAELAERIKELERDTGATSREAEEAAERLLLEAKCFERDNPTESKKIISSKYEAVFERYPHTKAAQEARKRCDDLSK